MCRLSARLSTGGAYKLYARLCARVYSGLAAGLYTGSRCGLIAWYANGLGSRTTSRLPTGL